jgi:hypothetical protein
VLKCVGTQRYLKHKDHPHQAKHAPIALTLLDCFSMASTTLKIQQDDASKWDALSLEGSHHKEHEKKYLKEQMLNNTQDDT